MDSLMKSVLLFGPTGSGKSTFGGYITTHSMDEAEFETIERTIHKKIIELCNYYDPCRRLAYFLDRNMNELPRYDRKGNRVVLVKHGASTGTTKSTKLDRVKIKEFGLELYLLDSPGSDQRRTKRLKNMAFSDIGVFLVNASELLDDIKTLKQLPAYLDALMEWIDQHGANTVIALTQIDLLASPAADIEYLTRALHKNRKLRDIRICPIFIDVKHRTDYNIFTPGNDPKYGVQKESLLEIVDKLTRESREHNTPALNSQPFFGYIESVVKPRWISDHVLRMRVLRGELREGGEINIGPAAPNKRLPVEMIEATVNTIQEHGTSEKAPRLSSGQIGGATLKFKNDYDLKDIRLRHNTVVFSDEKVVKGNYLQLRINFEDLEEETLALLYELRLLQQIDLVWFGRFVGVSIHGIVFEENYCLLELFSWDSLKKRKSQSPEARIESDLFVVPVQNEFDQTQYTVKQYLISLPGDKATLSAELTKVWYIESDSTVSINIVVPDKFDKETVATFLGKSHTEVLDNDDTTIIQLSHVTPKQMRTKAEKINDFLQSNLIMNNYRVFVDVSPEIAILEPQRIS